MNSLKIALLQIAPCGTLKDNLTKGIEACKKAKEMGADIALFPEMWSNGYQIYDRPVEEWKEEAIPADCDFVNSFGKLAKELEMAVGITLLEKYDEASRNSMVLFDRYGRKKITYAKVHPCDFDVERNLTPGEDFYVPALDTACGEVKVGAMICYDREFPESARILMLKGAELILVPNACPMEINRLSQLRGRAYENKLAIATCNYPETVPDCNGGSSVGTVIVEEASEYEAAKQEAFCYDDEIIIEQYIKGREFSVGVVDGKALPVIEIAPISGFYDYKNKYQAGSTIETCPANLEADLTKQMQQYAEAVFRALRLKNYARMDFMLKENGQMYCLEANTLPGMTATSLLPQEAAAVGISYGDLCEWLIEISLREEA